ncbi:hypothetical protein FISHEDRAFT_73161 [Fistulina hepatica ATCC 64428]|uniref:Cation/H+ exchanger domain-containing protein n=1 Tax=Fistulina hepatica ATCC 64428 TaxID=1128425 RepID=A0A0D7AGD8_9AGAR|nr:hypothetical protein FISHEDRAFT_73161 [Fistulina hepatica ATCC 64428]
MVFHPFKVSIPHVTYTCLGGFMLFNMFSLFLGEKLYISEVCWAFVFGIITGKRHPMPILHRHIRFRSWGGNDTVTNTIVLEFTRVVLAIAVFVIGVELPKAL